MFIFKDIHNLNYLSKQRRRKKSSRRLQKTSYFLSVLEDLKLRPEYDGFLFLAESARNPSLLHSHHHRELEVNLVVRGKIAYVADGQRYSFSQRSLLWMFPSQVHQLVDRSPDAQYYVAVFKPELIARSCHSRSYAGLKRKKTTGGVLHTVLDPESFDLMRRTMDSLMEGAPPADLLNREAGFGVKSDFVFRHKDPDGLNAGLHHLLLLSWRCHQNGRALSRVVSLHPAVQRALTVLEATESAIEFGPLARQSGVSSPYLSRLFKEQVGVPLAHYRNSLRLVRFWEHFQGKVRPTILEAALASGFGSYAQFYKVFHQAYGTGPRQVLSRDLPGTIK